MAWCSKSIDQDSRMAVHFAYWLTMGFIFDMDMKVVPTLLGYYEV